jgi:hypothetical protein
MATPWPDKPCPHCHQIITDLLLEMVPDGEHTTAAYKAINNRKPGGAVTCPYCQEAVEYDANGEDLVQSKLVPLRYSRLKTEDRAENYGRVFLNKVNTTPEEWLEHDKGMPGAFRGYHYAEIPEMKFHPEELEFLSAWAREEKAANPYILPAHQLQAAHQVKGVTLIRAIKAWARATGKRDEEIFTLSANSNPPWPWSSADECRDRLQEITAELAQSAKSDYQPNTATS